MSGDQLVFDMSSSPEQGQASVFVRKDWLSIQDSNNGSYVSNNIIIETSMLSNSNRYISYRDAFILMPLLITMTAPGPTNWDPTDPVTSADNVISLKNFYGSIIHSIQIDMNGSTISQTVPFIGLYTSSKLITTLSYQDCISHRLPSGFLLWLTSMASVLLTTGTVRAFPWPSACSLLQGCLTMKGSSNVRACGISTHRLFCRATHKPTPL